MEILGEETGRKENNLLPSKEDNWIIRVRMKQIEEIEAVEAVDETAEDSHIHKEIIEQVQQVMPEEEQLLDLAEFFKVFGDSTRIKILYVLSQSEMCVSEIAALLQMGQSAISHQLRVLKQMRLVKFRREGKAVFYSLSDSHIQTILNQGMEHIEE